MSNSHVNMPRAAKRPRGTKPKTGSRSAASMRKHREEMRRRGFKLVQIWVPDPDAPGFAEEMRRQSLAVANSPNEERHLRMLDEALDDLVKDPEWK